jgi:hypothetical protein
VVRTLARITCDSEPVTRLASITSGSLLAAWRRHGDARSADLRTLDEARFALDGARDQMRSTMVSGR